MDFSSGQLLNNRYRIEHKLGQGGMGAVYLATDTALDHPVAVKVNRNTAVQGSNQFLREARLLASLRHPNLPRVTDYFILDDSQYLVMDYIAGKDLDTLLKEEGPQPVAKVLEWVRQVGNALSFLHNQNPPIIHRDVKPANVRLSTEGEAILVDFGIAKVFDIGQATTTGAAGYTPGYAPPEQYGGSVRTGPYTDQYSLAALIYHMLTGEKPTDSVQRALGQSDLRPLSQLALGIPPGVEAAVKRALSLRPGDRFPDIDSFLQALVSRPVADEATILERPAVDLTLVGETQGLKAISLEEAPAPPRRANWLLIGIAGAAVVVILALAAVFGSRLLASRSPALPTAIADAGVTLAASLPPAVETPPTLTAAPTREPAQPSDTPAQQAIEQSPTAPALVTDTPLPTATPLPVGGGGLIIFASDRADGGVTLQLWSMRVAINDQGQVVATDVKQLTFSDGNKTQPAFSPDGTRLLFSAPGGDDGRKDIWVMNVDGSGEPMDLTRQGGDEFDAAWSPDGKWIAYTRDYRGDGVPTLYIIPADGSGSPSRLSTDQNESDPAWTPDSKLGLVMNLSGNKTFAIRGQTDARTGATPTSPYYVTPSYFDKTKVFGSMGQVTEPMFSPDGKFVVYTREFNYGKIKRIFLARSVILQETLDQDILKLTDTGFDSNPAWSPDGQWIIFTSRRDNNDAEIYIMRNSGQGQMNLTNFPGRDIDPAWQPAQP